MSSLLKFGIGLTLGALAFVGLTEYVKARILGGATWSAAAKETEHASAAAVDTIKQADAAATPLLTHYIEVRDRVRSNPAPSKHQVDTLISAADSARSADSSRIAKRDTAIGKLHDQVETLKNRPGPARLSAYAEGLWDFAHQMPVVRAGADFRLVSRLSLTAAIDASPRDRSIETRALVGAHYSFR